MTHESIFADLASVRRAPQLGKLDYEPLAVVGGEGYLGTAVCSLLERDRIEHWVVGPVKKRDPSGRYRDSSDLAASIRGARTVLHLASLTTPATGERDPDLDLANIKFTIDLISASTAEGVRRIVFASSGGTIYGELDGETATESFPTNPSCSYGIAKLASEGYLRNSALRGGPAATILRISNIYGGAQHVKGDQGVIGFLVGEIMAGRRFKLWGDTVRDYVHIDDVARAFLLAARCDTGSSEIFNVSTAIGTSLHELVANISKMCGRQAVCDSAPMRLFDLNYNVLANDKIGVILGWLPEITIEEGLWRIVAGSREGATNGASAGQSLAGATPGRE